MQQSRESLNTSALCSYLRTNAQIRFYLRYIGEEQEHVVCEPWKEGFLLDMHPLLHRVNQFQIDGHTLVFQLSLLSLSFFTAEMSLA